MANIYSSDEELKVVDVGRPPVDVPTGSVAYDDDDDDDVPDGRMSMRRDSTDEFTSEEEEPLTSTRSMGKTKKKRKANMTPPEELLEKAEKSAKKYTKKKMADRAIQHMMRCVPLARIVHGDGHWRLAESHANLANGYLLLKGLSAQGLYHAGIAKNILLSTVHTTDAAEKAKLLYTLIRVYFVLGRSQTMMKKYQEAEHNLIKAEKISDDRNKLPGIDEYEQADIDIKIAIALGKLCISQNKAALGASCFDKAVDLIKRNYGKDSAELIPVYQDMGRLEQSKGKHANHDHAIEMYLQAHSIANVCYPRQSDEVAQSAHMLALANAEADTEEGEISAERYLDDSVGIYQVLHGPHHAKTIEVQDDLCKLLLRTDRTDEAITLLKTLIDSKAGCYGDMSEEVAEAYKLFGSIRLSQGSMDKALKHFKKCLSIQVILYGNNHKKTKKTQQTVDMLLQSPSLAAQNAKSKEEQLKHRPRFNATVGRSAPLGVTQVK
ncbi:tetratricopeptide repeat protein 23-like [Ptychodera flava]|uniref:tetratricopeptide repeat protein 23-like n=1 Tax=Ptychodera flava TaxID=63121 RepID=UPI00396A943D